MNSFCLSSAYSKGIVHSKHITQFKAVCQSHVNSSYIFGICYKSAWWFTASSVLCFGLIYFLFGRDTLKYLNSYVQALQVAGSSPGWAPLRSGLGQATYTCVPLSPSSIIWYRPRGGVISLAGESNHRPGGKWWQPTTRFMTNVTCGLTAKKPGSAPCPTLVIDYETTLLY